MDVKAPTEHTLQQMDLARGDLLRVEWVDIAEDPVGNPVVAQLARRTSYGLFWAFQESLGVPCVVTTTTVDHDVQGQNGYTIYPLGCIRNLTVIKRVRRPHVRKPKAAPALAFPAKA
jgi:hypothetical protein